MGSVYAGLLGDAGNDVWAVDTCIEHVEAIRAHGIRVEGASGDRVVRIGATSDAASVGVVDLVVIATKAAHVRDAASSSSTLLGPDTVVLPIQNGLGSADIVAEIVGETRVVVGVVGGFGASVIAPGHVHHHGMELVRLGERMGSVTARTERIAQLWRAAGFTVRLYDDVDRLVWEKLICNVGFSGPCTVLGLTIGEVLADPDAWSVAARCALETHAVAVARGIRVEIDDPVSYLREFGRRIAGARPSMALDVLAGRPCEIDVINGAIPPRAAAVGLAAPVNETVTALVKSLEARSLPRPTSSATVLARESGEERRDRGCGGVEIVPEHAVTAGHRHRLELPEHGSLDRDPRAGAEDE